MVAGILFSCCLSIQANDICLCDYNLKVSSEQIYSILVSVM